MFIKRLLCCFFLTSTLHAEQLIIEPDAGRTPLLTAIQHAKSSVDVVMYGFTDLAFMNALINAHTDKKTVRILLEPEPYRATNENSLAIRQFRTANVDLYWPASSFQLTHEKALIFDQQTAMVLTFNLTHSSFRNERNFGLVLTDPGQLREIEAVFMADTHHQHFTVSQPNLVWSPDNSREKILRLIRSARSEIKIYAQDISDYKIIGALAASARSGIDVKILSSIPPEKLHGKKFSYLSKAGVTIHHSRHYYIHAKVMLIDQKRVLIGSINFTQSSLEKNRELSVITEDPNVIHQINTTFDDDWGTMQKTARHKLPTLSSRQLLHELNTLLRYL